MRVTLIGIKHLKGTSNRTGKPYAFSTGCFTSAMSDRDKENGCKGMDVHTPTIPDRFADVVKESAIGKDFDAEFYYSNGRENLGYIVPIDK